MKLDHDGIKFIISEQELKDNKEAIVNPLASWDVQNLLNLIKEFNHTPLTNFNKHDIQGEILKTSY